MPSGSCSIHPTELRVHFFPRGPAGRLKREGGERPHCCYLSPGLKVEPSLLPLFLWGQGNSGKKKRTISGSRDGWIGRRVKCGTKGKIRREKEKEGRHKIAESWLRWKKILYAHFLVCPFLEDFFISGPKYPYSVDSLAKFIPGPLEMLPEHGLQNCKTTEHTYRISIFQPSDCRDGLPCGHTRPVEITSYIHFCVIDVFYPLGKCWKVKNVVNVKRKSQHS